MFLSSSIIRLPFTAPNMMKHDVDCEMIDDDPVTMENIMSFERRGYLSPTTLRLHHSKEPCLGESRRDHELDITLAEKI